MIRSVLGVVLLAACGGHVPVPAPASGTLTEPAPRAVAPRVAPDVVPGELADPGVVDRIARRVRVRAIGAAWVRLGAKPLPTTERDPPDQPMPVLAEQGDKVRVVAEEDGARVAVWMQREDARPAAVRATQLTDAVGHADREFGAWLEPGAELELRAQANGRREVSLVSARVRVVGWAPVAALGTVWEVPPKVALVPHHTVAEHVLIRVAPAATAAVLAETLGDVRVAAGPVRGAWREVELQGDGVRVRGFVPVADVSDGAGDDWGTIGLGTYSTVSHAVRIDVPAGSCLFERAAGDPAGDVVGVTLKQRVRLGYPAEGEWQRVRIGTPWGTYLSYLRITSTGTFESCLP